MYRAKQDGPVVLVKVTVFNVIAYISTYYLLSIVKFNNKWRRIKLLSYCLRIYCLPEGLTFVIFLMVRVGDIHGTAMVTMGMSIRYHFHYLTLLLIFLSRSSIFID